jgi:uncharacterized protein DUF3352
MHVRRFVSMNALVLTFAFLGPITNSRAADIDKYLPDDTQIVLHANIRQILESDLGKQYLLPQLEAAIQGNAEAQQILSALGFDSLKGITSFTMAGPGDSEKKWLILVHAQVDLNKSRAAVEAFAAKQPQAVQIHKQGDLSYYETRDPKKPEHTFFAAFVDNETLVISPDKDYVLTTIAKKESKKSPAVDKKLVELVKKVDAKQSLWLALLPDNLVKALPQDKQTMDIAKKVQSFTAGIALNDGVQLSVRIQTPDAKSAQTVRQTLLGVQSLLILAIANNDQLKDFGPTLTDILNSIKIKLDQAVVGIDVSISAKQIEEGSRPSKSRKD